MIELYILKEFNNNDIYAFQIIDNKYFIFNIDTNRFEYDPKIKSIKNMDLYKKTTIKQLLQDTNILYIKRLLLNE